MFSFWQRGYIAETSWRYRQKCIWQVIKLADHMVMKLFLAKRKRQRTKKNIWTNN
jgi:hypothetical protein